MTAARSLLIAACAMPLVVGCTPAPEVMYMPDGSILYRPRSDATIRPATETPIFVYSADIVDKTNGYHLYQDQARVSISGFGDKLILWRLNRSSDGKKTIYFLTKYRTTKDNWPGIPGSSMEIVHAHVDGFFPFRDALYQHDFSFERVAAMLDRYAQDKQSRGLTYLDNRQAYVTQSALAQTERDRFPLRRPNFDYWWLKTTRDTVYFPVSRAVRYNPKTKTATAADGSTLFSENTGWSTGIDRSGMLSEISAEWSEKGGRNRWIVSMTPLRSHRDDYGETRAVRISGLKRPTWRNEPVQVEAPGRPPTAGSLADLINVSVPIAGPDAGHMIIVASPLERDPNPHLKVEAYRPVRYPGE